jgi:hypothetical protein
VDGAISINTYGVIKMNLGNILNLAAVALPFVASAFGGQQSSPSQTSSVASGKVSAGSFLQQGAQAFLTMQGKTEDARRPFSTTVQARQNRSVEQLTRMNPNVSYTAATVSSNPLIANQNVGTVMANLAQNARNQQLRSMLEPYIVRPNIRSEGVRTKLGKSTIV